MFLFLTYLAILFTMGAISIAKAKDKKHFMLMMFPSTVISLVICFFFVLISAFVIDKTPPIVTLKATYPLMVVDGKYANIGSDGFSVVYKNSNGKIVSTTYKDVRESETDKFYVEESNYAYKNKWAFFDLDRTKFIVYLPKDVLNIKQNVEK
jgi:hypothetical protein